jgi:hypothetical protein
MGIRNLMGIRTVGVVGMLLCGVFLGTSAQAALESRLGGDAAYDTVLDITWVTDAGLSGNNSWANQVAWADNLDTLGFDDWRLATISSTSSTTSAFNCNESTAADCANAGNELGYMFYHNLGGTAGTSETGMQTVDGVNLTGIQTHYWSGTEFNSIGALGFLFSNGLQIIDFKVNDGLSGWAVRSGDVGVVPIPAAVWLFGSALGLLGWMRRRTA